MKKFFYMFTAVLVLLGCEKTTELYKTVDVNLTNSCEDSNAAGDLPYDFCSEGMVGFKTDAGDRNAAKAVLAGPGQMTLTAKINAAATKVWFYTRGAVGAIQTFNVPASFDYKSQSEVMSSMVYCSQAADVTSAESVDVKLTPVTSAVALNVLDSEGTFAGKKITGIVLESAEAIIAGDLSLNFEKSGISAIANESKTVTITGSSLKVGTDESPLQVSAVVIPASFKGTITVKGEGFTSVTTIENPISLQAGYVRTINVDLSVADVTAAAGKLKVGVIGDSISSFQGMIPTGHAYYYPKSDCDVDVWQKSYWGLLITKYWDAELDMNVSWSGGCVAPNNVKAAGSDFISRAKKFVDPDVVLLHGGTNDCIASNGIDLGEFDYDSPFGGLSTFNNFRQSYIAVIKYIQGNWPDAKIIIILGDHVTGDFATSVVEIANHYNLPLVDFRVTETDDPDKQMTKYSGSHPDAAGMEYMAEKIYNETLGKI